MQIPEKAKQIDNILASVNLDRRQSGLMTVWIFEVFFGCVQHIMFGPYQAQKIAYLIAVHKAWMLHNTDEECPIFKLLYQELLKVESIGRIDVYLSSVSEDRTIAKARIEHAVLGWLRHLDYPKKGSPDSIRFNYRNAYQTFLEVIMESNDPDLVDKYLYATEDMVQTLIKDFLLLNP
jgi:hypothetical protein